jgi:hypothetical protein
MPMINIGHCAVAEGGKQMRNLLIGSFLLLIAATPLAAELKGQVLRSNGTPAAGVPIFLDKKETKTNGSGFYRFPNIAPGTYTLTVGGRNEQVTVPPQGTERNFRVQ